MLLCCIMLVIVFGVVVFFVFVGCLGGNLVNNGDFLQGFDFFVIDIVFLIEMIDLGYIYDLIGNMIVKVFYEIFVDFEGFDVFILVLGFVLWEQNDEVIEFIFIFEGDCVFFDGLFIEVKDVVFLLQCIQGMEDVKLNFFFGGLIIIEVDDKMIQFMFEILLLQLLVIFVNLVFGIVNFDVVMENGGVIDGIDLVQKFFDGELVGFGLFVFDIFDFSLQVVLMKNDEYNGDEVLDYKCVVVCNVFESVMQFVNFKGGDLMVVMDFNGDQVVGFGDDIIVDFVFFGQIIFLLLNQGVVGGDLVNVKIVEVICYVFDYDVLLEFVGVGVVQVMGVILFGFEGVFDSGVEQDFDKVKVVFVEVGYIGQMFKLQFLNDYLVGGVEFILFVECVQVQFEDVGIMVDFVFVLFVIEFDVYVNGIEGFGLWFWGLDYVDLVNFLFFVFGLKVGFCVGWVVEVNLEIVGIVVGVVVVIDFEQCMVVFIVFVEVMQVEGFFVLFIVFGCNIFFVDSVKGVVYNFVWEMDIVEIMFVG